MLLLHAHILSSLPLTLALDTSASVCIENYARCTIKQLFDDEGDGALVRCGSCHVEPSVHHS